MVGPETSLEHVERLQRETEAQLERFREAEAELRERLDDEETTGHLPYWLAVLRGGVRYGEMVLAWCGEVESILTKHGRRR